MIWNKLLFVQFLFVLFQSSKSDIVVHSENGPIRGKTVASGNIEAFLGIPYAEPPVGNLRFAKPVPKVSWTDVYEATQKPPACVQGDFGDIPDPNYMSEDCLYLNIWMPHPKDGVNELKNVMVYIHGGGFIFGTSSSEVYDGDKLAEQGDVVVVTINYRLGVLGFFTGFLDNAPGNQALHDQIQALRWIKDNAMHFHGDPDNIVIMGESAGSWSVSMHQISPLSQNLFKRAILLSGSAVNPLYNLENKMISSISQLYATELGCIENENVSLDSKTVLDCMRNVPTEKIQEAELKNFLTKALAMTPRVGDDFLPQNSTDLFRNGLFKDSEVLMGVTKDEGSLLLTIIDPETFGQIGGQVDEDLYNRTDAYDFIKTALLLRNIDPEEAEKITQNYLDDVDEENGYSYLKATSDAIGDLIINCGVIFQAEYQSVRGTPVYIYRFDHRTSDSPYADWMGVAHFDEVPFIFGNPVFDGDGFTAEEKQLSNDMMRMWINFAKTGNPTISGGVEWPKYTKENPKYYVLGGQDQVAVRPENYRCEKWRKVFQSPTDEYNIESWGDSVHVRPGLTYTARNSA